MGVSVEEKVARRLQGLGPPCPECGAAGMDDEGSWLCMVNECDVWRFDWDAIHSRMKEINLK
jgi:hypothetical protein